MSKIQPTKFNSVHEFLNFIPMEERKIVEYLRSIIFEALPESRERLAYNVPYYYRHSRICFVWPSSIPWGGVDSGVALGFCNGNLLSDEINYLEKGSQKKVYSKIFTSERQVDSDLLKSYLFEAREVDNYLNKS